jgi:general secretion pathway protein G
MAGEREVVRCERHPNRPAVATCVACGKPVCAECAEVVDGRYYCREDRPAAEAEAARPRTRSGALRPWFLLAVAAAVAVAWGALALLRPVMESGAKYYRAEMTRARLGEVAAAAGDFKKDVGRYPTQEEGLAALIKEPAEAGEWLGPYLPETYVADGAVVDADGLPLGYRASANEHVVLAVGADGKPGTADDVKLRFEGRAEEKRRPAFPSLWGFAKDSGRRRGPN